MARMDPLARLPVVERHQADRLLQIGIGPRRAHRMMAQQPLVERLMLGTDGRQQVVRTEVLHRRPGQPDRHVGQLAIEPRTFTIRHKPSRIDHAPARLDVGEQHVGENIERRNVGRARHRDTHADRAGQLPFDVDAEEPDIVAVVDRIAELFGEIGRDRALTPIGLVPELVDRGALFSRIRPPVVDALKQALNPISQSRWRLHR